MADTSPKFKSLNNSNYPEWSGDIKAWLMKMGYWKLVSGIEAKPAEGKELLAWELKAEKAADEIYLAVEQDQRVHIRAFMDDPVKMWQELEKAHVSKKPGARFNAYDDLFSIQKNESESLSDLGTRIENAMAAIVNLRPIGFTLKQLDEELQSMALIRALPTEYAHLANSLLLMDNLKKDTILQAFRAEEQNRQRQTEMVNRAQQFRSRTEGARKDRICQHYGKMGHLISSCWFLKDDSAKRARVYYHYEKKDHYISKYPDLVKDKGKDGSSQVHSANTETKVGENAANASAFTLGDISISNALHWNTDTGATSHMTPHCNWIRDYTPYRVPIRLADNSVVYSEGVGSVLFQPIIDGKIARDIEFSRVLHVPALKNNLLAVLFLTRKRGFNIHIGSDTMQFDIHGQTLFTARITKNGIGYLNGHTIDISENVYKSSTLPMDLSLWHKHLCHHNYDDILRLHKENLAEGLKLDSKAKPDPICEPCLAGKMHANPFPSSYHRAQNVLQLIHSDVHDVGVISYSGYRYWVTFIDDHSWYRAVVPIKKKSDVFDVFKRFKAWAENLLGFKIKAFRCDKGGEYISKLFIAFLDTCGIECQYTT